MKWQDYIVSDNEILLGKPTIKGTRLSVELIVNKLSEGETIEQLLESYPCLTKKALQAVFCYLEKCLLNIPFQNKIL